MKKRLLTALLSGALILTALAGCGQVAENQSGANDASAGGESGARDELIFVNYRDIRDLNPTCMPERCMPRAFFMTRW